MIFLKESVDHDFVRAVIRRHKLHPVPLVEQHLLPDHRIANKAGQVVRERYPWGQIVFATDFSGLEWTGISIDDYLEIPKWAWSIIEAGADREEDMALTRLDCLGSPQHSVICNGGWDARSRRDQPECSMLRICRAVKALADLYQIPPEDLVPSLTDEELLNLERTQKGDSLELDRFAEIRPLVERFSEILGARLNLDVWTDRRSAEPGDLFLREGFREDRFQVTICRVRTDDPKRWNAVVRIVPKVRHRTLTLYLRADYDLREVDWPEGIVVKTTRYEGWEVRGVSPGNYPQIVEALVGLIRKRFIPCYTIEEVTP